VDAILRWWPCTIVHGLRSVGGRSEVEPEQDISEVVEALRAQAFQNSSI